jgi:hypothetical protein
MTRTRSNNSTRTLLSCKEEEHSYKAKWEAEKGLVNKIQQDKQTIENLKFEAEKLSVRATMPRLLRSVTAN